MKKNILLSFLLFPLLMNATADVITLNFENIDRLESNQGWAPRNTAGTALIVGESSTATNDVFIVALSFDLTGQATAIQNATEITFDIDYTWVSNSGTNIELLGFGRADAALAATYATTTATSADTILGNTLTTGGSSSSDTVLGTLSYDVTSILKNLVDNSFDYAGFRLTAPSKLPGPSAGSGDVVGFYRFGDIPVDAATLTIIPEPSSLMLLGLAGVALAVALRRRAKI